MAATTWIESMGNLHCPTCDQRLVEQAGKHAVLGRPDPVYIGGNHHMCPAGHALPSEEELVAYRDANGYPPEAPVREVPPPR